MWWLLSTPHTTTTVCSCGFLPNAKESKFGFRARILQNLYGGPNVVKLLDVVRDPQSKTPSLVGHLVCKCTNADSIFHVSFMYLSCIFLYFSYVLTAYLRWSFWRWSLWGKRRYWLEASESNLWFLLIVESCLCAPRYSSTSTTRTSSSCIQRSQTTTLGTTSLRSSRLYISCTSVFVSYEIINFELNYGPVRPSTIATPKGSCTETWSRTTQNNSVVERPMYNDPTSSEVHVVHPHRFHQQIQLESGDLFCIFRPHKVMIDHENRPAAKRGRMPHLTT